MRTKSSARGIVAGKSQHFPACFERCNDGSNFLPSGQIRLSRNQGASRPLKPPRPSKRIEQVNLSEVYFNRLPVELRTVIWELASTIEDRVVSVYTITDGGLRAQAPPVLHICHESRAVAMKHYTLSFGGFSYNCLPRTPETEYWEDLRFQVMRALPPKVYFNVERDILYFRGDWNQSVEGEWGCFSQFPRLIDKADLDRVQKVGFQLNARMCSGGRDPGHGLEFRGWIQGPKYLYLGLEVAGHLNSRFIAFAEMENHHLEFLEEYDRNPAWVPLPKDDDRGDSEEKIIETFRFVKQETRRVYAKQTISVRTLRVHERSPPPEVCENVCPVLVVGVETV